MPTTNRPLFRLALPPGHRVTITIDGDQEAMGVTVTIHRGDHWLADVILDAMPGPRMLQEWVDTITKRGVHLEKT